MKIISRYILREHVGPFMFALTALTSLMLLNFISRQLGELVGKGLPASVIGEFFLLSIPFTIALTLPMSVLVAVLYAFSRLAAENEVTALKASGVSPWRLVTPPIVWGALMSLFLLAFNDQILPRANHRLKTLQDDISQTRPTFLLKAQVINAVSEGKLYLKAGEINPNTQKMREVVIYDLGDQTRRRTIYADSGVIAFRPNRKDLELELFHGQMQEVSTDKPGQLDRLFYQHDVVLVRDVSKGFEQTKTSADTRGDRELGVCEMQKRLRVADARYRAAILDYRYAKQTPTPPTTYTQARPAVPVADLKAPEPHGIGWAYCAVVTRLFGVKAAEAEELGNAGLHAIAPTDTVSARTAQDTVKKVAQDTTKRVAQDTTKKLARDTTKRTASDSAKKVAGDSARTPVPPRAPVASPSSSPSPRALVNGVLVDPRTGLPIAAPGAAAPSPQLPATPPGMMPAAPVPPAPGVILGTSTPAAPGTPGATPVPVSGDTSKTREQLNREEMLKHPPSETNAAAYTAKVADAKLRLDLAAQARNRFLIEIHKKFALAAACLIFVVLGAPIAVRFPRGGVGLVIGVSLLVFALYYVGLIGGEAMANKGIVPPFWAMWGTNVILTIVGVVLLLRMGHEQNSGRGGNWGDRWDRIRDALRRGRRPKLVNVGESA